MTRRLRTCIEAVYLLPIAKVGKANMKGKV
jgi:hypothetical protein